MRGMLRRAVKKSFLSCRNPRTASASLISLFLPERIRVNWLTICWDVFSCIDAPILILAPIWSIASPAHLAHYYQQYIHSSQLTIPMCSLSYAHQDQQLAKMALLQHLEAQIQEAAAKNRQLSQQLHLNSHQHYEKLVEDHKHHTNALQMLEKQLSNQKAHRNSQRNTIQKLQNEVTIYEQRLIEAAAKAQQKANRQEQEEEHNRRISQILKHQLELKQCSETNSMKLNYLKAKICSLDVKLENEEREIANIRQALHHKKFSEFKELGQSAWKNHRQSKDGNTVSTVEGSLTHENISSRIGYSERHQQDCAFISPIYVSTEEQLATLNEFQID